ncbi:MAG: helix-turn-helix domain-containing protein [Campylobacterales bacterium]|nr:helix-turn-helix domain-containing protein [Campylobacterales bacterium]
MEYLRSKEASQYLKIGKSTLWLFTKQGKIKSIKLSERVTVWNKADIDAFIASRSTEGAVNA